MSRIVKKFNQDWTFYLEETPNEKEVVCLPHTVTLTPANSSGGRNYQGVCYYEKSEYFGKEYANKKVFAEFEGAMGVTELYVNGKLVKTHYCGYTPFVSDITDYIIFGDINIFKLVLDNRDNDEVPPGKPQKDLDFSYDGGLYREAKLFICEKTYITNAILANKVAGGGIFVSYDSVSAEHADIRVRTNVKNESDTAKIKVVHELYDIENKIVAISSFDTKINRDGDEHYEQNISLDTPHLWNIDDPYIYNLKTLVYRDETLADEIETEIGVRDFRFTVDRGFVLNGRSMCVVGANYHQTYPYIGNGVPYSLFKRDILKLKSAGMDNIRSHYPFCDEFVSFCNRCGMTLIVSNVGWQFFKEGIFCERVIQNMRDIIRWQRNNPCIILWEPILNESFITYEYQKMMHDAVHEEYPYSPCYTASDWGPTDVSYKEYDPGMLGKGLERYGLVERRDDIQRPMWIREYGDAPDNFVDQNTVWRTPRRWGDYAMVQTVERMIGRFDTTVGNYTYVYAKKDLCGYGIWPGIEHNRGYHLNPCFGGYFDMFRIPKFCYHFMRSQLDVEKIDGYIFIANYWTEHSPGDVVVYSNCDKVRLYHDDVLVAEQSADTDAEEVKNPPFTFKDVRRKYKGRARSTLRAEGIVNGEVICKTKVMSPGVPVRLVLEADEMGVPFKADGSDIMLVHCKVLDKEGNIVPLSADDHPILFKVEGEGVLIGDIDIGANPIKPEGGIATVLVRSTKNAGEVKVTAEMLWKQTPELNIKSAELVMKSK